MAINKKPYELSVWSNFKYIQNGQTFQIKENKLAVIASSTLETQNKAFDIKLVRNINGQITLTFSLYAKYYDFISGQQIENTYVYLIKNETKLKLKYGDEWFDLIVKKCVEDSKNNKFTYTAEDEYVDELSKNGFDIVLDDTLNNNTGTLKELAKEIMTNTNWIIDTPDVSIQTIEEALVRLTTNTTLTANQVNETLTNGVTITKNCTIPANANVYAFYSSCKGSPKRFQFIYVPPNGDVDTGEQYITNDDRIIINKGSQFFIEYNDTSNIYTHKDTQGYDFVIPNTFSYHPSINNSQSVADTIAFIPVELRGKRYVFGQQSWYHPVLKKTLWRYEDLNNPDSVNPKTPDKWIWGCEEQKYITPQILQNFSGNNDFKSTNGWTAGIVIQKKLHNDVNYFGISGEVKAPSIDKDFNNFLDSGFDNFSPTTPILSYKIGSTAFSQKQQEEGAQHCLVGNGININKKAIKNLITGKKYVVLSRDVYGHGALDTCETPIIEVATYTYSTSKGVYIRSQNGPYLKFDDWKEVRLPVYENGSTSPTKDQIFYYATASVVNGPQNENQFQSFTTQFFIYPQSGKENICFSNFQFFEYIPVSDTDPTPLTPFTQKVEPTIQKKFSYYTQQELKANKKETEFETYAYYEAQEPVRNFVPVYYDTGEKVRSVKAKESNYFNILQSLSETFQSWLRFEFDRDPNSGAITIEYEYDNTTKDYKLMKGKHIVFKNESGEQNPVGFRYGANLKSIQRTLDSKNIVTKMIVKNNKNQQAPNGFCSIQYAAANETGENYLYDFTYYINHGLIDPTFLTKVLYNPQDSSGEDVRAGSRWNCLNYYNRLRYLNNQIKIRQDELNTINIPILKLESDLRVAEAGLETAKEECEKILKEFEQVADFKFVPTGEYGTDQKEIIKQNTSLKGLITRWLTYNNNEAQYSSEIANINSTLRQQKTRQITLNQEIEKYIRLKERLNKEFFSLFSRFIKEGTWIDEKYTDNEKYYIDALSTMYNSSFPKTSYTINVAEISQITGYEYYVYHLGDKTYIEDPEFFGYNLDGSPYREEVVVTEFTDMLDEPWKNSIKIQNYKTQFQDLFQRITASVQQAKYSEGSYNKAAALVDGQQAVKTSFVTDALNEGVWQLENAGQQTVTWGEHGITIQDTKNQEFQLRMIGGAILLKDGGGWKTALTSKGISADLITAGRINTGEISLYNGDQITFRWDAFGINAYDFSLSMKDTVYKSHTQRGVRFDRFGLYGYDCCYNSSSSGDMSFNSGTLHTTAELMARPEVQFALTWDGLKVIGNEYKFENEQPSYHTEVRMGKRSHNLYQDNGEYNTGYIFEALKQYTGSSEKVEPIFTIQDNGKATFYGDLVAKSGNTKVFAVENKENALEITLGNWKVKQNGLFSENNAISLSANGIWSDAFTPHESKQYCFKINNIFGVTTSGHLYANQAYFNEKGKISIWEFSKEGFQSIPEPSTQNSKTLTYILSTKGISMTESIPFYSDNGPDAIRHLPTEDIVLGIGQNGSKSTTGFSSQLVNGGYGSFHTFSYPIHVYTLVKDEYNDTFKKTLKRFEGERKTITFNLQNINQTENIPILLEIRGKGWIKNGKTWGYSDKYQTFNDRGAMFMQSFVVGTTIWGLYIDFASLFTEASRWKIYDINQDYRYESTIPVLLTSGTPENSSWQEDIDINVIWEYTAENKEVKLTFDSTDSTISPLLEVDAGDIGESAIGSLDSGTDIVVGLFSPASAGYNFWVTKKGEACAVSFHALNAANLSQTTMEEGAVISSDIKVKGNIEYLTSHIEYESLYDELKPSYYTLKRGTEGRKHFGLIAQDVKNSMDKLGIAFKDFAPYCEWGEDENKTCGIRYEELISLNIWEIQKLKKRISALEDELANLTFSQNSDIIYIEEKEQENDNNAN